MNRSICSRISIFSLFALFSLIPADRALCQGIWKSYTTADGLASNFVFSIAEDKLGNIWFGTWGGGLSKLDTNGVWSNFLTDSITYIKDIEFDSINNKWLALARSGITWVVKFDDSKFTYYSPSGYPKDDPKPICLGQDASGHIWCGTTTGLAYWFDGVNWNPVEIIPNSDWSFIREIKLDRKGNLYFAHDKGISAIKDGRVMWIWGAWLLYVTPDLAFDKQNRLWFTLLHEEPWGLGMIEGNICRLWSTSDGLLHNFTWAVAVDSSNNVWIAYATSPPYQGISKFDGLRFAHFNYQQGLPQKNIWDIYVDKKGLMWLATDGAGVVVLKDTTTDVHRSDQIDTSEKNFTLLHSYPNPFNSSTTIRYHLIKKSKVELSIYNLTGSEVMKLINEEQSAGLHQVIWNSKDNTGKEVTSGIYIAVLTSGNFKKSIKLTLIR